MKSVVIDASLALAWCFEDEWTPDANRLLHSLSDAQIYAPNIWLLEVSNSLVVAQRKGRLQPDQTPSKIRILRELSIQFQADAEDTVFGQITSLALAHQLSSYDASYLNLALRLEAPLATLDGTGRRQGLKQAAERCGVELVKAMTA